MSPANRPRRLPSRTGHSARCVWREGSRGGPRFSYISVAVATNHTTRSLCLRPDRAQARWSGPVPVTVILLLPVRMITIDVHTPDDEPAAQVATALLADPADGRTLAEWGRTSGPAGGPWHARSWPDRNAVRLVALVCPVARPAAPARGWSVADRSAMRRPRLRGPLPPGSRPMHG
jgi:hypothetical protein